MLYLDSSNVDEVKKFKEFGVISGVTTNPKILFKEKNKNVKKTIEELASINNFPVHVELTRTSGSDEDLIQEALEYCKLSENVVIKIPMWSDGRGIRIARHLKLLGKSVNMTCCMSMNQVVLASLVYADYISLFYNRMIDFYHQKVGESVEESSRIACDIIAASKDYLLASGSDSKIIVGSIRQMEDVLSGLMNGADIVTVPPKILAQMFYHPKSVETIKEFDTAWKKLNKNK